MSQLSKCGACRARHGLRLAGLSEGGRSRALARDTGGEVDIGGLGERTRDDCFRAHAVIGREFPVASVAAVG